MRKRHLLMIAGGVGLLLALIGLRLGMGQGVGIYESPVISPDGNTLAFVFADRSGTAATSDEALQVMDLRSGQITTITIDKSLRSTGVSGLLHCVAWQNNRSLWFKIFLGGELRQVDPVLVASRLVTRFKNKLWLGCSFDPRQPNELVFAMQSAFGLDKPDLYRLDVNTLAVTQLTNTSDIAERAPQWSPDGSLLAYGVPGGVNILDRGGTTRFIPDVYGDPWRYAWSPDNKWLLTIGGYQKPGLFLISVATGESRQISSEPYAFVAWASDHVVLLTVGVPGRNEMLIKTPGDLGLPSSS